MVSRNTTGKVISKKLSKTKKCKGCGRRLRLSSFNKKKAICKKCDVSLRKTRLNIARQYIYEYLMQHPCVDCMERNPVVLEFDHIIGIKAYRVGEIAKRNCSLETLKKEIAKCEIRCANCHRIRTAQNNGSWILNVHNN